MIRHVYKIYPICSFFDIKNSKKGLNRFLNKVRADKNDRYSYSSSAQS